MNKYITRIVQDSFGNAVAGMTMRLYKIGVTPDDETDIDGVDFVEAVEDSDLTGQYLFTVPDSFLSKYYNIYIVDGDYNPYETNLEIDWSWRIRNYTIVDGVAVLFSDLTDIAGVALPDTIDNAIIKTTLHNDRLIYFDITDEGVGFTPHLSVAGEDTLEVDLEITYGGE